MDIEVQKGHFMWVRVFIFSCLLQAHASIVSLDLCADQWVLELVSPSDIFAVTYLAKDPNISFWARRTRNLKTHRGTAEEFLNPNIKIVVTMDSLDPFLKDMLAKKGIKIIVLKSPKTLEEVEAQRHFLIKELGLKGCQETPNPPQAPPPLKRAICYGASGLSPGSHTLLDEALTKAGFKNGFKNFKEWKYVDWEKILDANPSLLFLLEDFSKNRNHPFWKHFIKNRKIYVLPKKITLCACSSSLNELIETMKKAHDA
jgi:iron complex transport system substrate-binding protein